MTWRIDIGDCRALLRAMAAGSVHTVVTSPPYWGLRDYDVDGQIGLEETPDHFVAVMVEVFEEVRRVLRDDGTLWLNLGDTYASSGGKGAGGNAARIGRAQKQRNLRTKPPSGLKPKDLIGLPWMVAFALRAAGWYLRQEIVWHKPNPVPECVEDRPTRSHEQVFLFAKSRNYFYDKHAIMEPVTGGAHSRGTGLHPKIAPAGTRIKANDSWSAAVSGLVAERNKRSVWTVGSEAFDGAHFATFPTALIMPCVLAGTSEIGCCPTCGAPWERVIGDPEPVEGRGSGSTRKLATDGAESRLSTHLGYSVPWEPHTTPTIAWARACACPHAPPVPCTVLDPFNGAGTTGVVATRRGRSYVGHELNPEYAALARRRILDDAPLFNRT